MADQNEKPTSIQDAMKGRSEQPRKDQGNPMNPKGIEMATQMAMRQMDLEARVDPNEQYPENAPPSGEKKRLPNPAPPTIPYKKGQSTPTTSSEVEAKSQKETPASSIDLPLAKPISTPESVETLERESNKNFEEDEQERARFESAKLRLYSEPEIDDPLLVSFRQYMTTRFSQQNVLVHLSGISRMPAVLPAFNTWDIAPQMFNAPQVVYDVLMSPGYIDTIWPTLRVVMGLSINNFQWVSVVAATMALFDAVKLLPYAKMCPPQTGTK